MKNTKKFTLEELIPKGNIPHISENYLEITGINKEFWKSIVIPAIKKRFEYKCCVCDSKKGLVVHHTSYEVQTIKNLFLVCRACHIKIHNKLKIKNGRSKPK